MKQKLHEDMRRFPVRGGRNATPAIHANLVYLFEAIEELRKEVAKLKAEKKSEAKSKINKE